MAVHWNAEVSFPCPTHCETKHPTMKALIVYDDATCAATTNAILHQAADRADISVKWDIRPWRLNMLRFPPTAEEAMSDAADAHLIVFAIRNTRSLPTWLMNWLERWAVLRQSPGAALAIIGCETAEASVAMRQFARRFGLSFIGEGQEPQLGVGLLVMFTKFQRFDRNASERLLHQNLEVEASRSSASTSRATSPNPQDLNSPACRNL